MKVGPLRLDYDAGDTVPSVGEIVYLLDRANVRPVVMQWSTSPGGKGTHVVIECDPPPRTCMEVAALQAMLGSDPRRESCNINRARMVDQRKVPKYWRDRWNVLYE